MKTKKISVTLYENGTIRNENGHLLGSVSNKIEFDSEHIIEQKFKMTEERYNELREAANLLRSIDKLIDENQNHSYKAIGDYVDWLLDEFIGKNNKLKDTLKKKIKKL